ncbi:RPB5 subunit of DNA-directed RNA polymerase [Schizopora paradoxa]|uniref:DNA-directed RNA polymerases I, II, and III subunit RPABC1 n=1 Tax=Schizopora paradoxa TaxID=27342 RepID=A0A0H2RN78_9AGAM|nr:RPB5 subunit of DNA-directed RNA polymerase [Schizopora paradoxa]
MSEIGGPEEAPRLWRVNRTIHELVKDRGFQVSDEEINMDLATFKAQYANNGGAVDRNQLNFFTSHEENPADHIFVYFSEDKSVGIKTMRKLLGILAEKSISKGIMIYPEKMTSKARQVIGAMSQNFRLEVFHESDLTVNITRHFLVPEHRVLTQTEKAQLLSRYRLKETQLPRIQLSDPVARYYGLRRGQVMKITRPSETAGRYCSYRIGF